jgi:hypothetical protein
VHADERARIERLSRYTLRASVARDRLHPTAEGDSLLARRFPWSDGTTHLLFGPLELLERPAVLIPPADTTQGSGLGWLWAELMRRSVGLDVLACPRYSPIENAPLGLEWWLAFSVKGSIDPTAGRQPCASVGPRDCWVRMRVERVSAAMREESVGDFDEELIARLHAGRQRVRL